MKATLIASLVLLTVALASCGLGPGQDNLNSRYTQERCIGDSTKFACTTSATLANTDTDAVMFELTNGAGDSVRITDLSTSPGGDCGTAESWSVERDGTTVASNDGTSEPIAPNDELITSVTCSTDIVEGSVFQDEFTIDYDIVDGVPGLSGRVEVVKKT